MRGCLGLSPIEHACRHELRLHRVSVDDTAYRRPHALCLSSCQLRLSRSNNPKHPLSSSGSMIMVRAMTSPTSSSRADSSSPKASRSSSVMMAPLRSLTTAAATTSTCPRKRPLPPSPHSAPTTNSNNSSGKLIVAAWLASQRAHRVRALGGALRRCPAQQAARARVGEAWYWRDL